MGRRDSRPLTEYSLRAAGTPAALLGAHPNHHERIHGADGIQQTVDGMQNLAADAASDDTNSLFPISFFSTNVNNAFWADWGFAGILSTVEARMDFLSSHAEINASTPPVRRLRRQWNPRGSGPQRRISRLAVDQCSVCGGFQVVAMNDNGTGGDAIAGDGMYSAALPEDAEQGFMFYFRAGNGDGIRLLPERAEYEYFIYEGTVDVAEAIGAMGHAATGC